MCTELNVDPAMIGSTLRLEQKLRDELSANGVEGIERVFVGRHCSAEFKLLRRLARTVEREKHLLQRQQEATKGGCGGLFAPPPKGDKGSERWSERWRQIVLQQRELIVELDAVLAATDQRATGHAIVLFTHELIA